MTAIFTIAVMTLIVATTLSIVSSKYGTTFQASSWQESLQGAEAGVDVAMAALNTGTWTGWSSLSGGPPRGIPPNNGNSASSYPDSTHYNYILPPTITHVGEGNNNVSMCVTVDTGGLPLDPNGKQWYRIRSAATADIAGPARGSSEKLDNVLRKVSLFKDRISGATVNKPQVTRSIEVIAQQVAAGIWDRGLTLKNSLSMSGGAYIDSFDSSNSFKSTNGLYDQAKRQSHGDIGILNSTFSDLKSTYVYGNLTYSGPPVKNTTNVQGTIATPFNAPTPPPVLAPTWNSSQIETTPTVVSGNATLTCGTKQHPTYYKLSSLNVPGGTTMTINKANNGPDNNYVYIWVTGDFTTSGSGFITQDTNAKVIYYLEGKMTVSGSSFNNQSGRAENLQIFGVTPSDGSTRNWTISGGGNFIAAVDAPNADVTISGGASFSGALIGNTVNISGTGGFHYDEELASLGGGSGASNYAFASWFEDVR